MLAVQKEGAEIERYGTVVYTLDIPQGPVLSGLDRGEYLVGVWGG